MVPPCISVSMINEKLLITKDLNLLLILVVLYKERNTARVAERLFVTQSAISKGLKRLREQLGDPLFVRNKNGFVPTKLCENIASKVEPLLFSLEQIYSCSGPLEPSNYKGELKVAVSAAFGHALAEDIYSALTEDFPQATLSLTTWSDSTEHDLLNGTIHIGINYYPINISSDLVPKVIKPMNFMFLTRLGHPLANRLVSLKDISKYPIVMPIIPNYTHKVSKLEHVFKNLGLTANIVLRSDNENLCMTCIRTSDAIIPVNDLTVQKLKNEYSILTTDFSPNTYVPPTFAAMYFSEQFLSSQLCSMVETSILKCFPTRDSES